MTYEIRSPRSVESKSEDRGSYGSFSAERSAVIISYSVQALIVVRI
jgi:hypothetical protein